MTKTNFSLGLNTKLVLLTDITNRAIQGNVAIQATQPGGHVCITKLNLCKWRHLMANISTNESDLIETKMM